MSRATASETPAFLSNEVAECRREWKVAKRNSWRCKSAFAHVSDALSLRRCSGVERGEDHSAPLLRGHVQQDFQFIHRKRTPVPLDRLQGLQLRRGILWNDPSISRRWAAPLNSIPAKFSPSHTRTCFKRSCRARMIRWFYPEFETDLVPPLVTTRSSVGAGGGNLSMRSKQRSK